MRRFLSALCALSVLLSMICLTTFAAAENGGQSYGSLQDALDNYTSGVIVLKEDAQNIAVSRDVYLDLNGHTVEGVTVTGGTLYCMDSQTDDFTVEDGKGYGTVSGVRGSIAPVTTQSGYAKHGYLMVTREEKTSFHCVNLEIFAMTLRPSVAGVYFRSHFAADEVAAEEIDSFGIALSLAGVPTAENMGTRGSYTAFTGFLPGPAGNETAANGTILTGVMKESNTDDINDRNANMDVYGAAYIRTESGILFGKPVQRDLLTQVKGIDDNWSKLNATQKSAINGMYDAFSGAMSRWGLVNIGKGPAGGDDSITLPISVVTEDGVVSQETVVTAEDISVTVPAGVQLAPGATELKLVVTQKKTSDSGLEVDQDQALMPVDVHMEGVSAENTIPFQVCLGKVMPENLNIGNYSIYHVENGQANAMTKVTTQAEADAHNEFHYDPVTGDVTLALANFSEIAMVTENENVWNGEFDYTWYTEAATEYIIANADQLAAFGAIVGGMDGKEADSFAGKTVKLIADIDLGDAEAENDENKIFYPIGYYNSTGSYEKVSGGSVSSGFQPFMGTFDGMGNTISNFYQNTWEMFGDYNDGYSGTPNHFRDGMGLFGKVYGGTVKNLTVANFSSDGEFTTTGVIAAYADSANGKSATFENIAVVDCNPRVYNIGNGGIVGCAGWYSREAIDVKNVPVTFKNITVDQTNKISALWGSYDVSCGGILGQYYPNSGCGIRFENCHVAAIMDVNNDVCANYQYYWYRYSGMLIGTVRANKTEGGYTVADTTGITAEDCTYTMGDWNEYWYCELVKNSLASYTHDHQFSRLTKIASLSEIQDENGWTKEGNFVIPAADNSSAVCYHIFKNAEGALYQHFHDKADESNPNIYETFDLDGDGELNDLKEDRQCYYMPFAQVLNGLGYGVKPTYEIDGFTEVENGTVLSEEKFQAIWDAGNAIETETSLAWSELFAAKDGANISEGTVHMFLSPVGEESTVKPAYVCVTDSGS